MGLSLVKQTINNASGTYTPNALLYGGFAFVQTGAIHINAPANAADLQILAFSFHQAAAGAGWPITWDEVYMLGSGPWPDGYLTQDHGHKVLAMHDDGQICPFYARAY
jgi:hypothetical protein